MRSVAAVVAKTVSMGTYDTLLRKSVHAGVIFKTYFDTRQG